MMLNLVGGIFCYWDDNMILFLILFMCWFLFFDLHMLYHSCIFRIKPNLIMVYRFSILLQNSVFTYFLGNLCWSVHQILFSTFIFFLFVVSVADFGNGMLGFVKWVWKQFSIFITWNNLRSTGICFLKLW